MYLLQNQNKCEKQPTMSLIVQLLSEETFNRYKRISQSWVECKLDLYLLECRERERRMGVTVRRSPLSINTKHLTRDCYSIMCPDVQSYNYTKLGFLCSCSKSRLQSPKFCEMLSCKFVKKNRCNYHII